MKAKTTNNLRDFSDMLTEHYEEQRRLGDIYREGMMSIPPLTIPDHIQKMLDLFNTLYRSNRMMFGYSLRTEKDVEDALTVYKETIEELRQIIKD